MEPATLPGGAEYLGDGRFYLCVDGAERQLDASEAPQGQARELRQEGLDLRLAHSHVQGLPAFASIGAPPPCSPPPPPMRPVGRTLMQVASIRGASVHPQKCKGRLKGGL